MRHWKITADAEALELVANVAGSVYEYLFVCTYVCIYIYIYVYTCMYIYGDVYVYVYENVYEYIYIYIYLRKAPCNCIQIIIYVCVYI